MSNDRLKGKRLAKRFSPETNRPVKYVHARRDQKDSKFDALLLSSQDPTGSCMNGDYCDWNLSAFSFQNQYDRRSCRSCRSGGLGCSEERYLLQLPKLVLVIDLGAWRMAPSAVLRSSRSVRSAPYSQWAQSARRGVSLVFVMLFCTNRSGLEFPVQIFFSRQ
eukprot:IDg9236t1